MKPDDYIYCYANQLNGLLQKAFDSFCEKEGHRVWAKRTRWKHALDALKKADLEIRPKNSGKLTR